MTDNKNPLLEELSSIPPKIFPIRMYGVPLGEIKIHPSCVLDLATAMIIASIKTAGFPKDDNGDPDTSNPKAERMATEFFERLVTNGPKKYKDSFVARPLLRVVEHVMCHMGAVVNESIVALFAEARSYAGVQLTKDIIEEYGVEAKQHGFNLQPLSDTPKRLARQLEKNIRRRINAPNHGGRRRVRQELTTPEECAELADEINKLRPFWVYITKYFEREDYDTGCVRSVRQTEKFRTLSIGYEVPDDLLKTVFRRKSRRSPDLEPLGLTIKHICSLYNFSSKPKTIRTRYFEGKRILNSMKSVQTQSFLETMQQLLNPKD